MKSSILFAVLVSLTGSLSVADTSTSNVFCITNHALAREKVAPHPPALENSSVLVHATLRDQKIVSVDSLLVRITPGNYKEFIQDGTSISGGVREDGSLSIAVQGDEIFSAFVWGGVKTPNKWVESAEGEWFKGLMDMGIRANAIGDGTILIEEDLWCRVDVR